MAEFGENLKRIREERGYTQQSLADYLFVTRQAVSRWEGGSRYPDLMTAKKMAQFLEVSLDDLLTDDDMKLYTEKNAIIENPTAKRVQLLLLSLAFMGTLLVCITLLTPVIFGEEDVFHLLLFRINAPANILTAVLLGITLVYAVLDRLNAKVTLVLYSCYFGLPILHDIIYLVLPLFGNNIRTEYDLTILFSRVMNILIIVFCIRFFASKRSASPVPLYILCGIMEGYAVISILITFFTEESLFNTPYLASTLTYVFTTLVILLMLVLLPVMAYVLHRKRKLSMR